MKTRLLYQPVLFLLLICPMTAASDGIAWHQWGGPHRDFKVPGVKLADAWPKSGLHQVWKHPLGEGFSSFVVADQRLFTMYCDKDEECVIALEAASGKTIWQHRYAVKELEGTSVKQFGPGALSTPLIVKNRLCAVGVNGMLHCLDLDRGNVIWKHSLIEKLKGTNLFRGYSASPIAYGESVILPVGGKGQAVVAFNLADGKIVWKSQDFAISHVSPILIHLEGQNQLIVVGEKVIVGLDPANGHLLWQHSHPIDGGYISSTPVWGDDGHLFFSAAYGNGSRCLRLTRDGKKTLVEEIWHNPRMRVHHSNVIREGDFVYGSSGDFAAFVFMAINIKTGKAAWKDRSLGRSTFIYADGKYIAMQEDGQLMLGSFSPEGLKILGQTKLFDSQAWTHPVLIGKRLYVRNREEIMAFELP